MLEMDRDKIGTGLLVIIDHGDPTKWKNTPVAVSQSIKILKAQQTQSIENFQHIKIFLEKLTKKILNFITTNEQEIGQLKNRITRDLQSIERNTEDKLKSIRKEVKESSEEFSNKIDAQVEEAQ